MKPSPDELIRTLAADLVRNNTAEILWRLQHDSPAMAAATAAAQVAHLTRWIALVQALGEDAPEIARTIERAKGPLSVPMPGAT